eukprot:Opistho-1_new@87081
MSMTSPLCIVASGPDARPCAPGSAAYSEAPAIGQPRLAMRTHALKLWSNANTTSFVSRTTGTGRSAVGSCGCWDPSVAVGGGRFERNATDTPVPSGCCARMAPNERSQSVHADRRGSHTRTESSPPMTRTLPSDTESHLHGEPTNRGGRSLRPVSLNVRSVPSSQTTATSEADPSSRCGRAGRSASHAGAPSCRHVSLYSDALTCAVSSAVAGASEPPSVTCMAGSGSCGCGGGGCCVWPTESFAATAGRFGAGPPSPSTTTDAFRFDGRSSLSCACCVLLFADVVSGCATTALCEGCGGATKGSCCAGENESFWKAVAVAFDCETSPVKALLTGALAPFPLSPKKVGWMRRLPSLVRDSTCCTATLDARTG